MAKAAIWSSSCRHTYRAYGIPYPPSASVTGDSVRRILQQRLQNESTAPHRGFGHMTQRTTVRLPEDLLNRAKRKAAAEGRTLTSLIEDGLRLIVTEKEKDTKRKRVQPRISKATGGPMPWVE